MFWSNVIADRRSTTSCQLESVALGSTSVESWIMTRADPWLASSSSIRSSVSKILSSDSDVDASGLSELPSFSAGGSISALTGWSISAWGLSASTMLGFAMTNPATSATAEKEVRRRCAVVFMTLRAMTEGSSTHTRCHVSDGFSAFAVEFRGRVVRADGEGGAAVRHRSHQ